jgi:ribosome-associated protein
MSIAINPDLSIKHDELDISFIRASGPGGQNVNKVATAAQLRFDARGSPSLPDDVATRLIRRAGARATKDGVIVITADRYRTQAQNRADAIARLVALIAAAAHKPKPRKATKLTAASRERRLDTKAKHAAVKKKRQFKPDTD